MLDRAVLLERESWDGTIPTELVYRWQVNISFREGLCHRAFPSGGQQATVPIDAYCKHQQCRGLTTSSWRSPRDAFSVLCVAKQWGNPSKFPHVDTDSAIPVCRNFSGKEPHLTNTVCFAGGTKRGNNNNNNIGNQHLKRWRRRYKTLKCVQMINSFVNQHKTVSHLRYIGIFISAHRPWVHLAANRIAGMFVCKYIANEVSCCSVMRQITDRQSSYMCTRRKCNIIPFRKRKERWVNSLMKS